MIVNSTCIASSGSNSPSDWAKPISGASISAVRGILRGDGWGRAIRLLGPLAALVLEGWPALIGALAVQETGLWVAGRIGGRCQEHDSRLAPRLFLAAYAARVAITLPTHYILKMRDGVGGLPGFQDDYSYSLVGESLVEIARGEPLAIFPGHQHVLDGVYPYILMGLYWVFGYTPLVPKLVNSGLGALSAVLVFDITRRTFSGRAAMLAGIGAALLPSLVIWSLGIFKESLLLFVTLVGLRLIQFACTNRGPTSRSRDALVLFFAVLMLLLDLRYIVAVIMVGLLVIALTTNARRRFSAHLSVLLVSALLGAILIVCAVFIAHTGIGSRPASTILGDTALEIRHRRAQEAAGANTAIRQNSEVQSPTGSELPAAEAASDNSPFSIESDIVEPFGFAILAPTPWQVRSLPELGLAAEMLVWYLLLAGTGVLWFRRPERHQLFIVCLILYAAANYVVLAAAEGNLANLVRHRLVVYPALLILGSAGVEELRHSFPGAIIHGRSGARRALLSVVGTGLDE